VCDPLDPLAVGEQRLGAEGGAMTGHPHSWSDIGPQSVQIAGAWLRSRAAPTPQAP
jgi:hypothetical protein